MQRSIKIKTFAVFLVLTIYNLAAAQPARVNKTTIYLCTEVEQKDETSWLNNVEMAFNRLSYGCYKTEEMSYEVVNQVSDGCTEIPGGSCVGESGKVTCKKDVLARILLAQAWTAASFVVSMEQSGGELVGKAISITDAFSLADAQLSGNRGTQQKISKRIINNMDGNHEQFKRIEQVVANLQYFDLHPETNLASFDPAAILSYGIYEPATNYLIAFILGHELSHAHGFCWMEEHSSLEKSGLFKDIINIQAEGKLFCPNPILVDELKADRCAMRVIQFMDESYSKCVNRQFTRRIDRLATYFLLSIGRRHAIDQLSLLFMLGLGHDTKEAIRSLGHITNDGMDTIAYVSKFDRGYISWPLRLILFSEQLRQREFVNKDWVGICNDTAQRIVIGMNMHLAYCQITGDKKTQALDHSRLPNAFKAFVPEGVLKGWKTGLWDDRANGSFRCPIMETSIAFGQALKSYKQADYQKALRIFLQLAEAGHVEAQYFLGKIYFDGNGITKNLNSAKYWFQKASDAGHPWSSYYLGAIYLDSGENEQGKKWLELAIKTGIKKVDALHLLKRDRTAKEMYDIGVLYIYGDGVRRDSLEAEKWFQKAAEAGFRRAWFSLGLMYSRGDGVPKNIPKAIIYFEKCSDDSDAKFILGTIYFQGDGVARNIKKAISLYREAAAGGNNRAKFMIEMMEQLEINLENAQERK